MSLSMYQASVPAFLQMLNNLSTILDKAEADARNRKIDSEVLLNYRLAPDMFPFVRQIQIAADLAKGAAARLAGVEVPKHDDTEKTFADLKARITNTATFVESIQPSDIDGSEGRDITLTLGEHTLNFKGQPYLLHFVLPNFYFHCTTAYDILRHCGVELGKRDFIDPPLNVRAGWPKPPSSLDDVVLADWGHAACLRALNAFVLCDHEPDFVADLKLIEVAIDHAVLMEINLLAVGCLGKPVIFKKLSDLAMRRCGVGLHVAAHAPDMVFELPPRSVERIPNGYIDILVGIGQWPGMANKHVLPRHADVNADIVELAFVVMLVGRLHHDLAADNPVVKLLELGGLLADPRLDCG